MKNLIFFVLLFILFFGKINAQVGGEFLVKIDVQNSTFTKKTYIPEVKWIKMWPFYGNVDAEAGKYFFLGKDAFENENIISVDIKSGFSVKYSKFPVLQDYDNILGLKFISDNEGFYALHWSHKNQMEYFIKVQNGTFTIIDSIPEIKWIANVDFSRTENKYFVLGADSMFRAKIYTIDLKSFTVSSTPVCSFSEIPNNYVAGLQYDDASEAYYGIQYNKSGDYTFVSLGRSDCNMRVLNKLADIVGFSTHALNTKTGNYIFIGLDKSGNSTMYNIDIKTGAIIQQTPFYIEPYDNVIEWRYYESINEIVALHWDHNIPLTEEFMLFPNPNNGDFQIMIKYGEEEKNASIKSITVIDVLGRIIYTEANPKTYYLTLNDLMPGIYFVSVETSAGTSTQKMVVQ